MNRAATLPRTRKSDPLAVDSTTLHQYYNTVQSGDSSERMVEAAMSRRQANALQAYRRRGYSRWLTTAAAVVLLVSTAWLLS